MISKRLTKNLILKNGIWFSKERSTVSYPVEGSSICRKIEDFSYWFKHRNRCIISIIKSFSNNETFVDVGGGNGIVAHSLQMVGISSILLEPNLTGIKNAKKRGLKNLICSSLEDGKFAKESVGAAGLFDVIEHIDNDLEFLKKVNVLLKKGGKIYLTAPAFQFLWSDEDKFAGHFRRYTVNNLKDKLEASGFKLIYSTYYFSILVIPILLTRSIPSLFRLRQKENGVGYEKEHKLKPDLIGNLIRKTLEWEIERIGKLKPIPFGSSCLIVAQKD